MAYPGDYKKLYVIPASKTVVPHKGSDYFKKIVVGSANGNLTLKGSGLYEEVASSAVLSNYDSTSGKTGVKDVLGPVLTGVLIENTPIEGSSVATGEAIPSGFTSAFSNDSIAPVKVYRNSVDITDSVTIPSFDSITVTGENEVTGILINSAGDGLRLGDVVQFNAVLSTADLGITITVTLDKEEYFKLAPGWYSYVSPSQTYTVPVVAGEELEGSFSSIQTPSNFTCKAYA